MVESQVSEGLLEGLLAKLSPYLTPFNICLYLFCSCAPSIFTVYMCRKFEGTPELNEKYHAFARLDYKHWGYFNIAMANLVFCFFIRYAFCWFLVPTYLIPLLIVMSCHK